jgi:hypothetical protein
MNQVTYLKYEYSNFLFRSLLFEQTISKDFLIFFFFLSCPEDSKSISALSIKCNGKIYLFQKSYLVDLTKQLYSSGSELRDIFYFRGMSSHKCVLLRLPLTSGNLKTFSDFSQTHRTVHLSFAMQNGLFLNSSVFKLVSLKGLPYLSNVIVVIYICLQIVLKRLLSRFLLLNLKRKLR